MVEELLERIERLERRVAELEAAGSTPTAPFRVVGARGETLLEVDQVEGCPCARLFDPAGRVAAVLVADAQGGTLDLYDPTGAMAGGIGASPLGGRVRIYTPDGKMVGALMATSEGGVGGLFSREGSGKVLLSAAAARTVAAVRHADEGTGILLYADAQGGAVNLYAPNGQLQLTFPDGKE